MGTFYQFFLPVSSKANFCKSSVLKYSKYFLVKSSIFFLNNKFFKSLFSILICYWLRNQQQQLYFLKENQYTYQQIFFTYFIIR